MARLPEAGFSLLSSAIQAFVAPLLAFLKRVTRIHFKMRKYLQKNNEVH